MSLFAGFGLFERRPDDITRPTEADAPAVAEAGGVDAAASLPCGVGETLPWIGYEDATADLPQARWLTEAGAPRRVRAVVLDDAKAVVQAVRPGLGGR